MNILVSGGMGFIGSHLVPMLEKNHTVSIYDRKNNRDLLDYKHFSEMFSIIKPDVVIHLAAELSNDVVKCQKDNIVATQNVVQRCKKKNIPVIFTSSCAVYGDNGHPKNVYGNSKFIAEQFVMSCEYYTILRLSNVYGKGGRGVINQWLELMKKNNPAKFTVSNTRRDFIHVSDVCKMINMTMKSMCVSKTNKREWQKMFNVSTSRSVDMSFLAGLLQRHTGAEIWTTTKEPEPEEIRDSIVKSNLPFKPIALEEGIKLV